MKKLLFKYLGIFVVIIAAIVLARFIYQRVPANIFCFLDIGTYRVPPTVVEVNAENTYGQSFISNFDNLFMISIFIPTQDLNKNQILIFHLKKKETDQNDFVRLQWKFNQLHPSKNNFYTIPPDREAVKEGFHFHFEVPPIIQSKNKSFYFYFESPDSHVNEGIKLGMWDKWSQRDHYEALTKGNAFENHKPMRGNLAFKTYHTMNTPLSTVFNEIKERLLKDKAFLSIYLALLTVLVMAFFLILFCKSKIRQKLFSKIVP